MSRELRPQQQAAAYTTGEHLCVDAGAGSGKTTVLVERIMHLLERDVKLRHIVAITFTRKAAGEMKERLRRAIHERPSNDPRSMDKWRAIELEVETARITTIDSFCASLLHENALHIGLDPDFTTLGDEEAPLLREEVAERTLIGLLDANDAAAQRLAVEHGFEALRGFVAETLDQFARFDAATREYSGLDADGVVTLWQTQADDAYKARCELFAVSPDVTRIAAGLTALAEQCSDPSDKREAVRREALHLIGVVRQANGDLKKSREAISGLAAMKFTGGSKRAWTSEDAMKAVKNFAEEARDLAEKLVEPAANPVLERASAQLTLDLIAVMKIASANYREAKQSRTAMDFADLLNCAVAMLRENPAVRARIAGGIRHLLIDEFQDTNRAQLELAKQLCGEGGAELFVVGDAKQSVYRFRGAEVEVFAEAKLWTRKTLRLDENFRSIPPVIEFINDFFHESALLTRVEPEFHRLRAGRAAPEPGPAIEFLLTEKSGDGDGSDGELMQESISDRLRQADLLAGRIIELCSSGGAQVLDETTKSWRPARFGDVAILYRAGTHAEIYEAALRMRGIPANVIAGSGFFARQEILDLHNLFAAALDPWNEPALAAFLRGPFAAVTDDTLARLTRETTLARAFHSGARTGDASEDAILDRARALIGFIQERREWPVAALMRELLALTGIESILLAQYHGAQKAANIHKLIDLARNFGGAGRLGLQAFAQHLSTLARNGLRAGDAELPSAEDGAVTLMNVHKAKGLEFPIVALVEMGRAQNGGNRTPLCLYSPRGMAVCTHDEVGESAWPTLGEHLSALDKDGDRAEEARVLYVAMTRARDHLLLVGPSEPRKNTWMRSLLEVFPAGGRDHGAPISGAAWEGRVIRKTTDATLDRARPKLATPDVAALLAQAQRIGEAHAPGDIVPVGAILDRLHSSVYAGGAAGPATNVELDRRALGSAAHAMLERWMLAGPPPLEEVAAEFFPADRENAQCRDELARIADTLRQSELWPLLTAVQTLQRELPFLFSLDGLYLNGKIDALLDGEVLVDYKLGGRSPARTLRHEAQLRLYAAAIAAATGRVPRRALLVYLDSGDLAEVDVSEGAIAHTVHAAKAVIAADIHASGSAARAANV